MSQSHLQSLFLYFKVLIVFISSLAVVHNFVILLLEHQLQKVDILYYSIVGSGHFLKLKWHGQRVRSNTLHTFQSKLQKNKTICDSREIKSNFAPSKYFLVTKENPTFIWANVSKESLQTLLCFVPIPSWGKSSALLNCLIFAKLHKHSHKVTSARAN